MIDTSQWHYYASAFIWWSGWCQFGNCSWLGQLNPHGHTVEQYCPLVDNWFLAFLQDFHPQPHPKGYLSSRLSQLYKTPIPYPDFHSDNLHALIGEVIMYCCFVGHWFGKRVDLASITDGKGTWGKQVEQSNTCHLCWPLIWQQSWSPCFIDDKEQKVNKLSVLEQQAINGCTVWGTEIRVWHRNPLPCCSVSNNQTFAISDFKSTLFCMKAMLCDNRYPTAVTWSFLLYLISGQSNYCVWLQKSHSLNR